MPVLSASLILAATLPVALLLATGFLLRQRGVIDEAFRAGLMTLVLRLFFPALVLAKVSVNPALRDNAVALWAPAAGFVSLLAGYTISRFFAGLAGADTPERRRAFVYSTGHYNYTYLAIPVCAILYGEDSVAILLLFNTGLEFCFWTIGIMTLTGGQLKDAWKRLLNPITSSMLAAMILNRTGVADHLPAWAFRYVDMLGDCAIPAGLLLVGMGLPALLAGFRAHHDARISTCAVLLRNGLIPACFVLAARFLPMPAEVSHILCLQAAMPAGLFSIVMCQYYRVAPQVALRVFVATTLAAIVTLPGWLWIGGHVLQR